LRICIFGAGAGGGHFAVRLQQAGHEVCVVARGKHLAAIRRDGIRLFIGREQLRASPIASEEPADLGLQDLVVVTVKATALARVADRMAPLIGPKTMVLFTQNGIPWWYPIGLSPAAPTPPRLASFDLAGHFLELVPAQQILGGVIYSANEVLEPGVVRNNSPGGNRIEIAPIATAPDSALDEVRAAFTDGGVASPVVEDIRRAVWRKVLLNMSASGIALVTGNQASIVRRDEALGGVYTRVVMEGLATAAAHGFDLSAEFDPQEMLHATLDHFKTMRQVGQWKSLRS
jgi:2-dehydropantoate 2-reductase